MQSINTIIILSLRGFNIQEGVTSVSDAPIHLVITVIRWFTKQRGLLVLNAWGKKIVAAVSAPPGGTDYTVVCIRDVY